MLILSAKEWADWVYVQWLGRARSMSSGRAGRSGDMLILRAGEWADVGHDDPCDGARDNDFCHTAWSMLILRAEEWAEWDMSSGRAGQRGTCSFFATASRGHAHFSLPGMGIFGICPTARASMGHVQGLPGRGRGMSSGGCRRGACPVVGCQRESSGRQWSAVAGLGGGFHGAGPVQTARVRTGAQVACRVRRSNGRLRGRRHGFHCA